MQNVDLSRLTSKYQTTIPLAIRSFLGLGKGDAVRFHIENNHVVLEKAKPLDWQFAKFAESTLNEWNSAEDDEAFRDL